jgi:hypothetical protein
LVAFISVTPLRCPKIGPRRAIHSSPEHEVLFMYFQLEKGQLLPYISPQYIIGEQLIALLLFSNEKDYLFAYLNMRLS